MFELPSMWNLIVSTIAFMIAAWYVRRYLEEQGLPKGTTRSLLVFILAYAVSWGAGEAADWTHEKISGSQPVAQAPDSVSQLLKEIDQPR